MKVIKSIRPVFLLFAGLALVCHMIIPHDHHLTGLTDGVEESCPLSHERQAHHPVFPIHCHAFNDLASEKSRPVQILQNLKLSLVTFSILNDTFALELQSSWFSPADFSKLIQDSYFLEFSQLRAPPSFSL